MIYLFTAMYCEAAPLIRQYHMKKDISQTRFQVFNGEEAGMRLVITGSGMIAAASALSGECAIYGAGRNDFSLNIGICAGKTELGRAFLCNQITDDTTGRVFYPDILYRHPFLEARAVTGARPFRAEEIGGGEKFCLYDMEAAALYQAGSYFFGPHQMGFLKIVSDSGSEQGISAERAGELIAARIGEIDEYVTRLRAAGFAGQACASEEKDFGIEQLCQDLRCTRAMSDSLMQHIRYCELAGTDYKAVIRQMYEERLLPCKDKREGKICFEEFKRRLL